MQLPIEWLPDAGLPEQLIVLLHGWGDGGAAMAPLARALRAEFPQAAILAPDAPQPRPGGGRQWFPAEGLDEATRIERVAQALDALLPWLVQTQQRLRVGPAATALAGFSQGAILALELAARDDGRAGRVLAFGGRYAALPAAAPALTTVHLFHGGADSVVPARHAQEALEVLGVLRGDATLDVAEGVGHTLHPALLRCALQRLRTHIPARTWAAALGSAPPRPPSIEPPELSDPH